MVRCPVYKETQCYTHSYTHNVQCPPLAVVRPRLPSPTSVQGEYNATHTHTLRDFLHSSSDWSRPLAVVRPRLPSPTSVQGDTVNTMLHTHTQEISYTHDEWSPQWYDPRRTRRHSATHTHTQRFHHLTGSRSGTTTSALAN